MRSSKDEKKKITIVAIGGWNKCLTSSVQAALKSTYKEMRQIPER